MTSPVPYLALLLFFAAASAFADVPAPSYDDACLPKAKKEGDTCVQGKTKGRCVGLTDAHIDPDPGGDNPVFRCDGGKCLRCLPDEFLLDARTELDSARRLIAVKKPVEAEKLLASIRPLRRSHDCERNFLRARAAEGTADFKTATKRMQQVVCDKWQNLAQYHLACYSSRLGELEDAANSLLLLEAYLEGLDSKVADWERYDRLLDNDPDLGPLRGHPRFKLARKRFAEQLGWARDRKNLKPYCVPDYVFGTEEHKFVAKEPCKIGAFHNRDCQAHYRLAWAEKLPKLGECRNDEGRTEAEHQKWLDDD